MHTYIHTYINQNQINANLYKHFVMYVRTYLPSSPSLFPDSGSNMGYVCGVQWVGLMGYTIRSANGISPSLKFLSNNDGIVNKFPDLLIYTVLRLSLNQDGSRN